LKKYHFYLIVGFLISVLSPSVVAELKIGFVNIVKVMDKAPQVKSANKRLKRELAPRREEIETAKQELRKKEKRLAKNASIMSEQQVRKLSRDVREKRRELARLQDEFQEDINIRRNEELDKIHQVITRVIRELGKSSKYDLILSDGVLFWSKRIDITDQVLRRLSPSRRRHKRR
jgi:outer membrane protein